MKKFRIVYYTVFSILSVLLFATAIVCAFNPVWSGEVFASIVGTVSDETFQVLQKILLVIIVLIVAAIPLVNKECSK